MADIRAAQSGDFSATATWTGGVVPGSGDIAYANTFTVTISDTRTVQAISNAAGTGITVGGTFSLLNGCNLTCTNANGVVQGNTTTSCVTTPSLTLGNTATVAANFTNTTTTSSAHAVTFSTAGTLNWTGNTTGGSGGSGNTQFGVSITGTGVFNGTGNYTGGSTSGGHALNVTSNATITITGNVGTLGGGAAAGLTMTNGNVTVNGNVTGGNSGTGGGINNNGSTTLTVNGACQSGTTTPAIMTGSSAQITRLSGPFLLGASGNINPVQAASWRWAPTQIPTFFEVSTSGGTTRRNLYTGDNMPSGGYPTAANVRSGIVYGPNSENTGTLAVPAAGSVALGVAVDNSVGTAVLTQANVRAAMGLASANLDAQFAALPTAAQIAAAVWNTLTSAATTVGSLGKLLANNLDATISSRSNYDGGDTAGTTTLLGRLTSNRATNLDNLDAPVSGLPSAVSIASSVWAAATRTLTTAIPSASDVASAVWSAVARTLTSSSAPTAADNAAAVWSYASGRTITGGTVDTLVNAPTVPSVAQITAGVWGQSSAGLTTAGTIGAQVAGSLDATITSRLAAASYSAAPTTAAIRTELSAELARLDVAVSTRLAPSGTLARVTLADTVTTVTNATSSSAPTAQQNAAAVRSELSAELARIANCSTVDTTATTIQDALSAD